jgi:hypothetical protein
LFLYDVRADVRRFFKSTAAYRSKKGTGRADEKTFKQQKNLRVRVGAVLWAFTS